jgi:hypothetical protein
MAFRMTQVQPLATERRPARPLPKGRPSGTGLDHQVHNNETLESVAHKYGISVKQLVMHNFGTMDAREINWYLREYVGCNLPTHDHKNWRFSDSARPGLIYIPAARVLTMDPITIIGKAPQVAANLSVPGPPDMLASEKFALEYEFPKTGVADLGTFIAAAKIGVSGELKQEGGLLKITLRRDQVKLAVEKSLSDVTKATFTGKIDLDQKKLEPLTNAILKGDQKGFLTAVAKQFEATIKTTYHWGVFAIEPEIGLNPAKLFTKGTFLVMKLTAAYEDSLIIEQTRFKGKLALTGGLDVGLSAKSWAWLAERVGQPALRFFLQQGPRALVAVGEWLVSEAVLTAGIVVVGTVLGTLGLTAFMAWVVEDARRKGTLTGLATWYPGAYVRRVFDRPYTRYVSFVMPDVAATRDKLIELGEKDALLDARKILSAQKSPDANGTDQEALDAYRMVLLNENQGSEERARTKLRLALEEKSRRLVGL